MWQTRVLVPVRESEIPMRRGPWPVLAPGGPSYFLQPRALEPPLFYAEGHSLENLPAVSDAELALENAFAPSKSGTANKAACPLNIHRASQAHGNASGPATPPDCHLPACRQIPGAALEEHDPRKPEGALPIAVADGGGSVADRWNLV